MKTQIKMTLIGTTVALALALAAWTPAFAADAQIKGAQRLMKPAAAAEAAAPATMKCAQCKSVFVEKTNIEKGHIKVVTLAEKHVCPGCDNLSKVVGTGKAKKDVVTHVCSLSPGGAALCCAGK